MENATAAELALVTTDALLEGDVAALPALAAQSAELFPAHLDAFVARLQAAHDAYFAHAGYSWTETYSVDRSFKGRRFVRIVITRGTSDDRSVVCFVELGTSLIYKAGTFKKPVENFTRGCIFNLGTAWQTPDGEPAAISPHY